MILLLIHAHANKTIFFHHLVDRLLFVVFPVQHFYLFVIFKISLQLFFIVILISDNRNVFFEINNAKLCLIFDANIHFIATIKSGFSSLSLIAINNAKLYFLFSKNNKSKSFKENFVPFVHVFVIDFQVPVSTFANDNSPKQTTIFSQFRIRFWRSFERKLIFFKKCMETMTMFT